MLSMERGSSACALCMHACVQVELFLVLFFRKLLMRKSRARNPFAFVKSRICHDMLMALGTVVI
uniref:Clone 1083 transcribed RNA sequence n=1 Tax=Plectreurys tristis TaxID=33319 RepID=A0A0C4W9V1_PLETR|nr:hypothetical protein [Plectreurys tristis]